MVTTEITQKGTLPLTHDYQNFGKGTMKSSRPRKPAFETQMIAVAPQLTANQKQNSEKAEE